MRVLIFLAALIAGIYSGWSEHQKSGSLVERAGTSAGCPAELSAQQVSNWARQSATTVFVFKAGELIETTSERSLFSKRGWNEFVKAMDSSGQSQDGRIGTEALRVSSMGLEVLGEPVASPSRMIKNTVVAEWKIEMTVLVTPAEARMAGPFNVTMLLSCPKNNANQPLAIEQFIMVTAR